MIIDPRRLTQLAEFDTPTICNAIEMFDVRPKGAGYMDGRIRAAFRGLPPMVGLASTARMCSSDVPSGEDADASLERQIAHIHQLAAPAVVVYQDVQEPAIGATVGEVMCSIYRTSGAAGLITSGAARDLAQIEAMQFPLFMSSVIASHAYSRTIKVAIPVEVGGLTILPGDLLHGDENGVTTIPLDVVDELPDVAREYVEAERIVTDSKSDGVNGASQLLERRRAMGEAVAALKRRVARPNRIMST